MFLSLQIWFICVVYKMYLKRCICRTWDLHFPNYFWCVEKWDKEAPWEYEFIQAQLFLYNLKFNLKPNFIQTLIYSPPISLPLLLFQISPFFGRNSSACYFNWFYLNINNEQNSLKFLNKGICFMKLWIEGTFYWIDSKIENFLDLTKEENSNSSQGKREGLK